MKQKASIVLVGSPNVGKSVIFNYLTGTYVTVSNYPGTTVEVSRGQCRIADKSFEVIDTPGLYSLVPLTDEERVTRELLCSVQPDILVHVVDAKNLRRMLNMTLQLLDGDFPVILDLNIIDEAERLGMKIDVKTLAEVLGIPVVVTAAVKKVGLVNLKAAIDSYHYKPCTMMQFSEDLETAITSISAKLSQSYSISKRLAALLLLQGDSLMHSEVRRLERNYEDIVAIINEVSARYDVCLEYVLAVQRQAMVDKIMALAVKQGKSHRMKSLALLDRATREPVTGLPILGLVLYFGLYQFVGNFGAGYLVDYINTAIFIDIINPFIAKIVNNSVPWEWGQSLLIGDYGFFTLGFRYAVAIILPIVGTFFLAFAVLEDCGYLPRLAMLVDRLFKQFGLNGRAVIPITLGLGCGTMAVMVTRTLETRRERILATFLLAITIPCSAQLGVVLALLSHNAKAVVLWGLYIIIVFIAAGWLSARVLPGERSAFYMEIPPLRLPSLQNILTKAYTRMSLYFIEILPVFLLTSFALWAADRSGILPDIIAALKPLMLLLGLPPETAQTFLLGFFRRDYGAAGLYDMSMSGMLSDHQLLVAAITLTLFVPCVAQMVVTIKERGVLTALIMLLLIAVLAFCSGWLCHIMLTTMRLL